MEQKGFRKPFEGMDPPAQCLLYGVHSQRTLQRKLWSPSHKHVMQRSEAGCIEAAYTKSILRDCSRLWARYVRDSVPPLAQVSPVSVIDC